MGFVCEKQKGRNLDRNQPLIGVSPESFAAFWLDLQVRPVPKEFHGQWRLLRTHPDETQHPVERVQRHIREVWSQVIYFCFLLVKRTSSGKHFSVVPPSNSLDSVAAY